MLSHLAIVSAKFTTWVLRKTGRGAATTLPGRIARQIDPQVLSKLSAQIKHRLFLVTGTNGKTTTSSLLHHLHTISGLSMIYNRGGANLVTGLTSTMIQSTNAYGKLKSGSLGVLETDEANMPKACKEIEPQYVVVTNFFRDQLDRFGELDHTVDLVRRGIKALPAGSKVFLNADDPLVASLAERIDLEYIFFGLDDLNLTRTEMDQSAEAYLCPHCGEVLKYNYFYYAHHGDYLCHHCGFKRPQPTYTLSNVHIKGLMGNEFTLNCPNSSLNLKSNLPGVYNLYNVLAASTAYVETSDCSQLFDNLTEGLLSLPPAFGRMESFTLESKKIYMALVKNPTGCNEVIRTFLSTEEPLNLLFILNDRAADGTDISWIWDADFEVLIKYKDRINSLTVSGMRAAELALRLKYAGLDIELHDIVVKPEQAFERAYSNLSSEQSLHVMPTYTAMLVLRDYFVSRGYLQEYWKE